MAGHKSRIRPGSIICSKTVVAATHPMLHIIVNEWAYLWEYTLYPLHVELFYGSKKKCLQFLSILKIDMLEVLETFHKKSRGLYVLRSQCHVSWWPGDALTKCIGSLNSSPPGENGCHFADNILKCIFLNEKFCIWIRISLKFISKGPIDNNWALFQVMAWCQIGDKPLPEPMLIQFINTYMRH